MKTYQDFLAAGDKAAFIHALIGEHTASAAYTTARSADEYDAQRNETILNYVKILFSVTGSRLVDFTAANNKLTSNFFSRLCMQRCTYSLGNGLTFTDESIKEKLGADFDTVLKDAGYYALIHGTAYIFWNYDRAHLFKLTEFAPLYDEETGVLRAGVRFWQLEPERPMYARLYTEDGYEKYRIESGAVSLIGERRAYMQTVAVSKAAGEQLVGEDNYGSLPIVPLYGSRLRQSELCGMRSKIDSYDLIRSGFANDLTDCAQIYWLLENYGGMEPGDLERVRDQLKLLHFASVDTSQGGRITPYVQEIPFEARKAYLDMLREGIYEDFGGLDVHTVAAGATNDHIDAAYQPLDENADDYEYQIIRCVMQLLALIGVEGKAAVPGFKRNRISNVREQVETVMLEAPYLDDETILKKLPNITPEEVASVLERRAADGMTRFEGSGGEAE